MHLPDPQYKTADGSALRIWRDEAQNNFLSQREGRPIFDEVIYAEIISPGSRDSAPVLELVRHFAPEMNHPGPMFHSRYDDYKHFVEDFERKSATDASLAGTPLGEWSEIPRRLAATLRASNIYTVDALAALPDSKLSAVGLDGRVWRAKAEAYLQTAKNAAYATELAGQIDALKAELQASRDREHVMATRLDELEAAKNGGEVPSLVADDATPPTPPII